MMKLGLRLIHKRDTHSHQDLPGAGFEFHPSTDLATRGRSLALLRHARRRPGSERRKSRFKTGVKIDTTLAGQIVRLAQQKIQQRMDIVFPHAPNQAIFDLQPSPARLTPAVAQIQNYTGRLLSRIGISMHAAVCAGREFGPHPISRQAHRVVSGFGGLGQMIVMGGSAAWVQVQFAGGRQKQNVAVSIASATRALQVGVAETLDEIACVLICVHTKSLDHRVGTELDHAMRHERAGDGVARTQGTDEGIHECGHVLTRPTAPGKQAPVVVLAGRQQAQSDNHP